MHLALGSGLLAEDSNSKLLIVKGSAGISIVDFEKGTKLLLREVHAGLFEDAAELCEVNSSLVHDVKVLKHLHEAGLFRHLGGRLLNQLIFESFLKPKEIEIYG